MRRRSIVSLSSFSLFSASRRLGVQTDFLSPVNCRQRLPNRVPQSQDCFSNAISVPDLPLDFPIHAGRFQNSIIGSSLLDGGGPTRSGPPPDVRRMPTDGSTSNSMTWLLGHRPLWIKFIVKQCRSLMGGIVHQMFGLQAAEPIDQRIAGLVERSSAAGDSSSASSSSSATGGEDSSFLVDFVFQRQLSRRERIGRHQIGVSNSAGINSVGQKLASETFPAVSPPRGRDGDSCTTFSVGLKILLRQRIDERGEGSILRHVALSFDRLFNYFMHFKRSVDFVVFIDGGWSSSIVRLVPNCDRGFLDRRRDVPQRQHPVPPASSSVSGGNSSNSLSGGSSNSASGRFIGLNADQFVHFVRG